MHKIEKYLPLYLPALFGLVVFIIFQPITHSQTDFYNNLWAPAWQLVQGQSPYNTESLHTDLPALWMPPLVGVFSFLGFFSFDDAQQIWSLLNIIGLVLTYHLVSSKLRSLPLFLTVPMLVFFFPPVVNHLALGQVSILIMLSLLLAVKFADRSPWISAFFLAVGLAKPQLGFLMILGLGFYQFQYGGLKGLVWYGMQTLIAVFILTVPLFLAEPNWIPEFVSSLGRNAQWTQPSLLSQFQQWLGAWGYLPWAVLCIAIVWITIQIWQNQTRIPAAVWTLALTLLITPYVWSWDFVLLLPLFVFLLSNLNWKRVATLVTGYVLAWVGMAVIQLSDKFHNSRFWWVPLIFVLLCTWVVRLNLFARSEGTLASSKET